MEARATINGARVSRTFIASALVLAAMGLSAMGGYLAGSTFKSGAAAGAVNGSVAVHPAAGTVLRQDNSAQAPAELPGWMQRELAGQPANAINVDDPSFYRQYLSSPAAESQPDHGPLP